LPALSCAVTFPTGIVGSIVTLLLLKQVFRVDPAREAADFAAARRRNVEPLERRTLVVANPRLDGLRLDAVPGRDEFGITVSRVRHGEQTQTATDAAVLRESDRIVAV